MPMIFMWLGLVGAASAQECSAIDLDAEVEYAVGSVTDLDLDDARRVAEAAILNLGCLQRVADPQDLATLWQVLGASDVYDGNTAAAAPDFAQAAAVAPGFFNDRLGPEPRAAWEAAAQTVTGEVTLDVWPISGNAVLYIDGVIREERPVTLAPGAHLIQVAVGADVVFGRVITMEAGQSARVETGLPEPEREKPPVPLILGVVSALGAAGAYTGAVLIDRELAGYSAAGDADALSQARARSVTLGYAVTPALAVGAAAGITLHIRSR
ncbi:hypothetical protein L6R49_02640 [Myxococcota bacterium]|nr:hypothetical protein [Myxococcota bacterium]